MSLSPRDSTRLNHALDMLLKHLLQSETVPSADEESPPVQLENDPPHSFGLEGLDEGRSSNASRSARRKRRPPPDFNS